MRQGVSEAKRDALRKNELKELADLLGMTTQQLKDELEEETFGEGLGSVGRRIKETGPSTLATTTILKGIGGKVSDMFSVPGYKDSGKIKDVKIKSAPSMILGGIAKRFAGGGLAEATAKLKAKGMSEGGMMTKDKVVSMDTSPNSGLITTKGFGAGKRT